MLKYYLLITVTSPLSSAHMNVNTTAPANLKSREEEDNKKLEDERGAVIGGIVGGLIFLSLMVTILAFLVRRKNNPKTPESATPERRGSVSTSNHESDTRPASDKSGIYVVSAMVTTAGIGSSYTCDRDTSLGYSAVPPNFTFNVAAPAQAGLGQTCQSEGTTPLPPASSIIHVTPKLGRGRFIMRGMDNSVESKEEKGSYELNVKSGHDLAVGTITGGHGLSTKMSSSVKDQKDFADVTVSQVATTCVNHKELGNDLDNDRCAKKSAHPHLSPRDSQKPAIRNVSNNPHIPFSKNNEIESLSLVGMEELSSSIIISGQVTIGQLSCDNPIKITKKSHHKIRNVSTIGGCFMDSRQETARNSAKEDKRKGVVRKEKSIEFHCSFEGQSSSGETHAPDEFDTSVQARQDDSLKLAHVASSRCGSHRGNKHSHTSPRVPSGRQRRLDSSDNRRRSEREITQQNTPLEELTNSEDIPTTSDQESSFCGNADLKTGHQENSGNQISPDVTEVRKLRSKFLPPVQVEEKNIEDKRSSNILDTDHDENCDISKWYKSCPNSRRFSGEDIRFNTSMGSPSVTQKRMLSLPLVLFPNQKRNVPKMTEFPLASLRFDNGYLNDCAHSGVGEERQREGVRPVGNSHEQAGADQDTADKKENCATAALVESTVSSFCGQLLLNTHPMPTVEKCPPSSYNLPGDDGQQSGSHHLKEDHSKQRRQPVALQTKLSRKSNIGSDKTHERHGNIPLGISLSNQRSLAQYQQLLRIKTDDRLKSGSPSSSVKNPRDNNPPKPKENTSDSQFQPQSGKNLAGSQKHLSSMPKASKCLNVVHKRGFPLQNTCVTTDDCKPNHIINRRREEFLKNLWQSIAKEDKLLKNHGVKMSSIKTNGRFDLPEKGVGSCNVSKLSRAYFPVKELSFPRRRLTMGHLVKGNKTKTKPPLTRSMSLPQANPRVSVDGKEKQKGLKSSKVIHKAKSSMRISVPSSLARSNSSPKPPVYFGIPPTAHPPPRLTLNRSKCAISKPPSLDWSVGRERLSSYRETNHATGAYGRRFRTTSLFSRYMNSQAD